MSEQPTAGSSKNLSQQNKNMTASSRLSLSKERLPVELSAQPAGELLSAITEERNPDTLDLDTLETLDLVAKVQKQDYAVADAVQKCIPEIARAVDGIVEKLSSGGRLFYFGAGTSGRLGVLDAAECPPTFGVNPELVQGIIAGGPPAVFVSSEQQEDHQENGAHDVITSGIMDKDAVVGICAGGRTPYVLGVLEQAKASGAFTALITNNPVANNPPAADTSVSATAALSAFAESPSAGDLSVDVVIAAIVGPEALTGSTRMKAGSAQKMILNLISTSVMVKLGRVYGNLMVDLRPNSKKLHQRALRIICTVTGVLPSEAEKALGAANNSSKTAILMLKRGCNLAQAEALLDEHHGCLRKALII